MAPTGSGLGPAMLEQELDKHLEQAVRLAVLLGMPSEELVSRLREDRGQNGREMT